MAETGKKLPCDICDTHDNVNSFCLNCRQNFCDNCKKGHQRTSSTRDHKFVPIGHGDTNPEKGTTKEYCSLHGAVKQFFCRGCSKTACTLCLKEQHQQHEFSLIDQYVGFTRFDISKKVTDAENHLEEIDRCIQQQTSDIEKCRRQTDDNIAYVKTTITKWMQDLKEVEEELIDKMQMETNEEIENLRNNMHELANQKTKYSTQLEVVKEQLRTCTDLSLLEEKGDIFSRLDAVVPQSSAPGPKPTLPSVKLRHSSKEILKELLLNTDSSSSRVDPVLSGAQSDHFLSDQNPGNRLFPPLNKLMILDTCDVGESVFDIAPISESKTWIGTRHSVMLVCLTGDVVLQRKHGMRGTSVARTTTGDALYVSSDSVITRIDQTGCVSEFVDIVSRTINYITSSRLNDDIFVATDQCILRLSHDAKIKATLECSALALTELSNGNIVAINDKREIVLLPADGGLPLTKTSITWSWSRFFSTLTRDSRDRIIVGDPFGSQLYVYKHTGAEIELVRMYSVDMDNTGIYTITADKQDRLWIGTPWDGIITLELSD